MYRLAKSFSHPFPSCKYPWIKAGTFFSLRFNVDCDATESLYGVNDEIFSDSLSEGQRPQTALPRPQRRRFQVLDPPPLSIVIE